MKDWLKASECVQILHMEYLTQNFNKYTTCLKGFIVAISYNKESQTEKKICEKGLWVQITKMYVNGLQISVRFIIGNQNFESHQSLISD